MANANSTSRTDIKTLLDALDAIYHTKNMVEFLQGALTHQEGSPEHLNLNGLHYIFQDILDRLDDSDLILKSSFKNNPAPAGNADSEIRKYFDQIFLSLSGLKEHSKHSEVEPTQIESIEDITGNALHGILDSINISN